MRKLINTFILLLLTAISSSAQLYLPHNNYYQTEAERLLIHNKNDTTFYHNHVSLRPMLDTRTNRDSIFEISDKKYYWVTEKLFKENLIIFKGPDFWCSIDPILDLELGGDLSADSLERLHWNTRGIRVQGRFFDNVGFTTSFYENQALLPGYMNAYADAHGEFFPNSINTNYIQNNAVIPGYARTKVFKTTGYDFAFAQGNISYVPNQYINAQIGNGNHFVGNGYRSLLLSDFTANYPFAKVEANFLKGRIQYNVIYALHQNLYRLHVYTTPEATYEKKIGTYQYLDISLSENVQIGIFEGKLWRRVDSLGSHKPDYGFLNPLIFTTPRAKQLENGGFNSILGLNVSINFGNNRIYGQAVVDAGILGAFQIGYKFFNLKGHKLDGGVEFNHANLNTYLSTDKRYNYSHYNLPLAHPYVNGFNELILYVSYQHNRFFFRNRINYSQRTQNDSTAIGNDILLPLYNGTPTTANRLDYIAYNQFEMGYRFNKSNNFQAFFGLLTRSELDAVNNPLTNYPYIGVRTRLKNKYLDY